MPINKREARDFFNRLNWAYRNHPYLLKNMRADRRGLRYDFEQYLKLISKSGG